MPASRFAIGTPGLALRLLATCERDDTQHLLQPGEVAFEVVGNLPPFPLRIVSTGDAVETIYPTIDELRARRWLDAKAYRDAAQAGTCRTSWGVVDIDADSQRKIVGAATAAGFAKSAGSPFTVDWTMHDNSVVTLDADAVIAIGMAVVAFLDACQRAGTAIRDAIEAATDSASIAAIDITAGYPA